MNNNLSLFESIIFSNKVEKRFYKEYNSNENFKKWLLNILPEVELCFGFNQKSIWHLYDVLKHTLMATGKATKLSKNLDKIYVGQILSIERHPDADKLIICQVDLGDKKLQIVTGASNVNVGDKVPVVVDGGKVAGGHDGGPLPEDGIIIKNGKLRGVESFGMMCSPAELKCGSDDKNIIELNAEQTIGTEY